MWGKKKERKLSVSESLNPCKSLEEKIAFCCSFGEKIKTKQPRINKQLDSSKGLIVPRLE